MDDIKKIRDQISEKGLKVTPQRIAIYKALLDLEDHPTAEMVKKHVSKENPNISLGTVYKTLEVFVEKNLITKVKTEDDKMRYDPVLEEHHHLFCQRTESIGDYYDEELNQILQDYFQKKDIPNFKIKDIKLHIIGEFINQ
jgi:Fur family peroxide stress response transcriptional regulator